MSRLGQKSSTRTQQTKLLDIENQSPTNNSIAYQAGDPTNGRTESTGSNDSHATSPTTLHVVAFHRLQQQALFRRCHSSPTLLSLQAEHVHFIVNATRTTIDNESDENTPFGKMKMMHKTIHPLALEADDILPVLTLYDSEDDDFMVDG